MAAGATTGGQQPVPATSAGSHTLFAAVLTGVREGNHEVAYGSSGSGTLVKRAHPPYRYRPHCMVNAAGARPPLLPWRCRNGRGHRLADPPEEALEAANDLGRSLGAAAGLRRPNSRVRDSSGIGICAILDAVTGQVVATTEPAPYHHKAIAGRGRFLVGSQGYGSFSSTLYDRDGRVLQAWPSRGMMLIDRHGTIRGLALHDELLIFRAASAAMPPRIG